MADAAGDITNEWESVSFGEAHPDFALDVAYQKAHNRFVVGSRNPAGSMVNTYWVVNDDGTTGGAGSMESGLTFDGTFATNEMVTETAEDLALATLGEQGFVSALRPQPGTAPSMVTWESRTTDCGGGTCSTPFRVARNDEDVNPAFGVALEGAPVLTDSFSAGWRLAHTAGADWHKTREVTALAGGDIDGDGREELAVGRDAGSGMRYEVLRFDSSSQAWAAVLDQGGAEWNSARGVTALAMGDVDGDGDDELAVGRDANSGMRFEVLDFKNGSWVHLYANGGENWGNTRGVTALALGDVDGDKDEELAIGRDSGDAMRFEVLDFQDGGWVHLYKNGGESWGNTRGVTALAMGDVDGDKDDELAIGRDAGDNMRYEILDFKNGAWPALLSDGGVKWGTSRGVTALAMGNGDGDKEGVAELAVGRDAGPNMRFHVVRYNVNKDEWEGTLAEGGSDLPNGRGVQALAFPNVDSDANAEFAVGLDRSSGVRHLLFDWGIPQRVRATVSDALLEANLGEGNGRLYERIPVNELAVAQNASVGKFITLLMAVEALEAGVIALDTSVKISDIAGKIGGSHMGPDPCGEDDCLEPGDDMPLEMLLFAMMNRSDNRAANAIAESLGGSVEAFLQNASERANQIFAERNVAPRFDVDCLTSYDPNSGLACFTNPAGSSFTTLQDLTTLWRYATQYPEFNRIADAPTVPATLDTCGTNINGEPKCFKPEVIHKGGSGGYPGQGGWKGGNLGHSPSFGIPWCTACLISEATRLDRTMIVALQQTGDTWGDNNRLLDRGFRKVFAPDLRAQKDTSNLVRDFGLDAVKDDVAVTAAIHATGQLQVCTWDISLEGGTVGTSSCTNGGVSGLPAGPPAVLRATTVDIALLSTARAEGDYVVGHLVPAGGDHALHLTGWRVGTKY